MKCFKISLFFFSFISFLSVSHASTGVKGLPETTPRPSRLNETSKAAEKKEKNLFISLDPFTIPIFRKDSPAGYMGMQIILKATDPASAKLLKNQLPRVYSSLFVELFILGDIVWESENEINIISLKKHLDKVCEHLFGLDFVDDVLIQNIYVRKVS